MSSKKKRKYRDDTETSFGSNCVMVSEKAPTSHTAVTRSSSYNIFSGGLNALTSKLTKAPSSPKKSPFKPRPPSLSHSPQNASPVTPVTQPPAKQKLSNTKSHSSIGRKLSLNVFSSLSTQQAQDYSSSSSSSSSDSDSDSSSSSDSSSDHGERLEEEKIETSRPNDYRLHQESKVSVDLSSVVLQEEVQLSKFCCVSNLMDTIVILASSPGTPPLDAETRVFTADRKCIGVIYETFGPVKQPFYSILFDSPQVIRAAGLKIGQPLYCSPADRQLTQFVFMRDVKKGSDASWIDDREPPAGAVEFSDDETEQREKAQRKAGNKPGKQLSSCTPDAGACLPSTHPPSGSANRPMRPAPEPSPPTDPVQTMDVFFLNPNTQTSPLRHLAGAAPTSFVTLPVSTDPSTNFSSENRANLVPLQEETAYPVSTNPSTNFSSENRANLVPLQEETAYPVSTDPSTNFSSENQADLVPLQEETAYPVSTDPSTNFSAENRANLVPLQEETAYPVSTDPSTNFSSENQADLVPLQEETAYPVFTDPSTNFSAENRANLVPLQEETAYPVSTDPSTNFSSENQADLVPLQEETAYPVSTDPSTNFSSENQADLVPLQEETAYPVSTDPSTNFSSENQANLVPLQEETAYPVFTDPEFQCRDSANLVPLQEENPVSTDLALISVQRIGLTSSHYRKRLPILSPQILALISVQRIRLTSSHYRKRLPILSPQILALISRITNLVPFSAENQRIGLTSSHYRKRLPILSPQILALISVLRIGLTSSPYRKRLPILSSQILALISVMRIGLTSSHYRKRLPILSCQILITLTSHFPKRSPPQLIISLLLSCTARNLRQSLKASNTRNLIPLLYREDLFEQATIYLNNCLVC